MTPTVNIKSIAFDVDMPGPVSTTSEQANNPRSPLHIEPFSTTFDRRFIFEQTVFFL